MPSDTKLFASDSGAAIIALMHRRDDSSVSNDRSTLLHRKSGEKVDCSQSRFPDESPILSI